MARTNLFYLEPDQDTLMSWTQKHPEHWTQNEILDWIYFVAGTIDVDPTTIRGEGFQNISGPELCGMTEENFLTRDPVNGKLFYDMFRMLFKDSKLLDRVLFFSSTFFHSRFFTLLFREEQTTIF